MENLLDLTPQRATALVASLGGNEQHALAVLRGVYRSRAGGPEPHDLPEVAARLPNLPRRLRDGLPRDWEVRLPRVVQRQVSEADPGTVKLLLAGSDGATFETVLFRNRRAAGRWSLCVSTQAGCRMACPFCATGLAGLTRNLTAGEIVAQLLLAKRELPEGGAITNLVAMGMGEPLDNADAVLDAFRILHHPACGSLAADRMVVSTCGHVPGLERLAQFPIPIGLAVSLHAADDTLRDRLVPLNKRWPLAALLETLRRHPLRTGKWICFEYILLKGVNDSSEHAAALGPLLAGLRALVQVIPYNPVPGLRFESPSEADTREFASRVRSGGVPVAVRWSRGPDIDAACGQLAGEAASKTRT